MLEHGRIDNHSHKEIIKKKFFSAISGKYYYEELLN